MDDLIRREINITLAKRNLVDYIWKSANMEGVMVTYPETDAIFNGINVPNYKVEDIILINNLKHAWRFILDHLDYKLDFAFICKINQFVGSNLYYGAGSLRTIPVSIGGTTYKPTMPIESQIKDDIKKILTNSNIVDRAISLMCFLMKRQMFIDGNKRTSILAANHVLICNGSGIISISQDHTIKFGELVKHYYETDELEELKLFLIKNCLLEIPYEV